MSWLSDTIEEMDLQTDSGRQGMPDGVFVRSVELMRFCFKSKFELEG